MKKIIIAIILLTSYTTSFASGTCLIKDKSAPVLTDYIKNNRQVVKNLTNAIVKEKNKQDDNQITEQNKVSSKFGKQLLNAKNKVKNAGQKLKNEGNEISSIFNEMFNFTGYYSYFKYYVTYPISNEVPFQVKRDYKLLDKENKGLVEYIKKLDQKGNTNIVVTNACKGVTKGLDSCKLKLNNKKTKEIIGKLVQNNDLILNLYRTTIIGDKNDLTFNKLILVDNNFILDIQKYYGKQAVAACNEEKEGFFKQISDAISDIKLINKKSNDGIKKWKDAYALLLGNKPDESNKIEQKKLKEYLNNKGIPGDKQAIINSNLEKYGSQGFSLNNNFLENTYSSTMKKFDKDISLWKKENIGQTIPQDQKSINMKYLEKTKSNSQLTREIQTKMTDLYSKEIPFAALGDINTEKLRSTIINSHLNIQDSINTLEKTIKVSRKVCKAQGGGGKCD